MQPSRSTLALRDMREYNLTRLGNIDSDLAMRLRALLSNGLPWYRILRNEEEEQLDIPESEPSEKGTEDEGPSRTTVLIYEEIGGSFGISANEFVQDLNGIDTDEIDIRINSPGGALFDGITIYNALNAHPSYIRTIVDGIAASAASIIAMAGDEVVMMPGSQLMIHDAIGVTTGNAETHAQMQTFLNRQSDNIASIYAYRHGDQSEEAIKNWRSAMLAETWYMASEAVESGLADKVYLKPKKAPETGEAMEAEVDEDEDGNPVPPEQEEKDPPAEDVQALLHRPHMIRNSRYRNRRSAPKPFIPPTKNSHFRFDVEAFVKKAQEGLQ